MLIGNIKLQTADADVVLREVGGQYLDAVWYSCAVHPAGHVDCVPPDIILGFPGSNHSCYHRPHVQP